MIAAARLRECLDYNQETGVFRWRTVTSNRVKIGDVAGTPDGHGHIRIKVDGRRYGAHRLAWLYVHGRWPEDEIDHINLIPGDNRIANLREATHHQNARNCTIRRHNKLGFKGVRRHPASPNRFMAQIAVNGRKVYLGLYSTPELAHQAYVQASKEYHGIYGRTE